MEAVSEAEIGGILHIHYTHWTQSKLLLDTHSWGKKKPKNSFEKPRANPELRDLTEEPFLSFLCVESIILHIPTARHTSLLFWENSF